MVAEVRESRSMAAAATATAMAVETARATEVVIRSVKENGDLGLC